MNRYNRKNLRREADFQNMQTYDSYYTRMKNLALNLFKWENLPKTVDKRYLELTLYNKGFVVFFESPAGYVALNATLGPKMNVYNIPIQRNVFAVNGYQAKLDINNSVIIWNNYLHTNTDFIVQNFLNRMYHVERAIDINIRNQKMPKIIGCDKETEEKILNAYAMIDSNNFIIVTDSGTQTALTSGDSITTFDVSTPYVADKLLVARNQIWNEFLTFLGIENANNDKKERLVSDEVSSNSGNIEGERLIMLNARRDACEEINDMFGLNVSVRYDSDLVSRVNTPDQFAVTAQSTDEQGGADDELPDDNSQ